jgi:hypothetical protein
MDVIAESIEILDKNEPLIGPVAAHAAGVFVNDMPDARDLFTDLHNLIHLFLVVAKDHGDIHVVQQLGDFLRHGGLVDGCGNAANSLCTNGGEQHFRNVVADQGDGIAFF